MEWEKGNFGYSLDLKHGNAFVSLSATVNKWEWSANSNNLYMPSHTYGFCYDFEEAKAYAEAFLEVARKIEEKAWEK